MKKFPLKIQVQNLMKIRPPVQLYLLIIIVKDLTDIGRITTQVGMKNQMLIITTQVGTENQILITHVYFAKENILLRLVM